MTTARPDHRYGSPMGRMAVDRMAVGRMLWQLPLALALGALAVAAIGPSAAAVPALYLAATTPELTFVDLRERRLPDRMTLPGIAVGAVAVAVEGVATRTVPWIPIIAAVALTVVFFALALAGGMGLGDVKLVAVIGLASPTLGIAVAAPLAAFLLGGVVSIVVLIRRGRGARIPFGPFLLAGYAVALAAQLAVGLA
jgi:leader peptidase (prepilin peptidase) / N-methyltransferase